MVIEVGPSSGWVGDVIRQAEIELQVANPNHGGWRWRNVKRKTHRLDALELARLSAGNQWPQVYLPERGVRQWRSLIHYRQRIVPRQYQSGQMNRQGRINGQGDRRVRALLIEVSRIGQRYKPWMRETFERVCRNSRTRRKTAVVAVARRLVIRCWAMLRDQTTWSPPPATRAA